MHNARFTVHLDDDEIGSSDLEFGDPPMGVAFGRFVPNMRFDRAAALLPGAGLSVRGVDGSSIGAVGIGILGDEGADLELQILGVSAAEYRALFPAHVAAYAAASGDG